MSVRMPERSGWIRSFSEKRKRNSKFPEKSEEFEANRSFPDCVPQILPKLFHIGLKLSRLEPLLNVVRDLKAIRSLSLVRMFGVVDVHRSLSGSLG
ncbi:hypothetical protein SBA4_860015 [Candidatus Sulfopaludibacter sp. SbA4]|nr:hypothetical protein SBA4_860015 [Candidatus Sulfopaludibacter sp. SbA4]